MIVVDRMMTKGLGWVLNKIAQAALAELSDDTPLREALLEAGLRLEVGEITQEAFELLEDELLARINMIRARDDVATGPIEFPAQAMPEAGEALEVEASLTGDFHAAVPPATPRRQRERRKRRSGAQAA